MPIILGPKEKSTLTLCMYIMIAMTGIAWTITLPFLYLGETFLLGTMLATLAAQLAFIVARMQFLIAKDSAKKIAKYCFCMAAFSIAWSLYAYFDHYNHQVNPNSWFGGMGNTFRGIFTLVNFIQLLPILGLIPALTVENPSPLEPSDEELQALWQAKLQEKHVE